MTTLRGTDPSVTFVGWFDDTQLTVGATVPKSFTAAMSEHKRIAERTLGALSDVLCLVSTGAGPSTVEGCDGGDLAQMLDVDVQRAMGRAVSLRAPELTLFSGNESGISGNPIVERHHIENAPGPHPVLVPETRADSATAGGLLRRLDAWSSIADDLCVAASALLGCAVTVVGLVGVSTDLRPDEVSVPRLLVPLGGTAEVFEAQASKHGHFPLSIEAGTAVVVDGHVQIQGSSEFVGVVLTPLPLSEHDAKRYAALKGAHSPMLRSDVPFDVHEPVSHYGQAALSNTVEFLAAELDRLDPEEILFEADLQRRLMCSVGGSGRWATVALTSTADQLDRLEFVGTIPLGAAVLGRGEERAHVAGDGKILSVRNTMIEAVALLLSGRRFTLAELEALDDGDGRDAITAFLSAGWADVARPAPRPSDNMLP